MMRSLAVVAATLLTSCATGGAGAPSGVPAEDCSKACFQSLRGEISKAKKALDEADELAEMQPSEENNAKAAEAAADLAMAHGDLDAARVDCSVGGP